MINARVVCRDITSGGGGRGARAGGLPLLLAFEAMQSVNLEHIRHEVYRIGLSYPAILVSLKILHYYLKYDY